ncbi:hypothetical protein B484DRAFT_391861 [Ochromonadaceae sp. CCMP2298]|nr:hypothetical protein B484DRAFT_391861 [Ochromonadaceae sp. CCMP2298]
MIALEDPSVVSGKFSLGEGEKIDITYKLLEGEGNDVISFPCRVGHTHSEDTGPHADTGRSEEYLNYSADEALTRFLKNRSPFDTGTIDQSVRAIPAEDLGVSLDTSKVLEEIRLSLVPHSSQIDAALHKVNVYTADLLKPHQDPPRDDRCFGTLIVCLPIPFGGGQLLLHGAEYDFSAAISPALPPLSPLSKYALEVAEPRPVVQWAAFLGDTHSIKPVVAGCCVTLTYLLRHVDTFLPRSVPACPYVGESAYTLKGLSVSRGLKKSGTRAELIARLRDKDAHSLQTTDYTDQEACFKGKAMFDVLRAALMNPLLTAERLAFPCMHVYEQASDFPRTQAGKDVTAGQLRLKGADAFLYIAAGRMGLRSAPLSLTHSL